MNIKTRKRPALWIILLVCLTGIMSACGPKAKLVVVKPAEINTDKINKIAIGFFEIISVKETVIKENQGIWNVDSMELNDDQKKAIARQIRAQAINSLSTTPYFQLIYTDEFEKLENDNNLQNLISATGYKSESVDAVITGKIWLELEKTSGSDLSKSEMRFVSGGRNSMDISVEKLLWWPYQSMRGTLTLEIKLTRLNPTEVVASIIDSRSFSTKIGGEPADFMTKMKDSVDMATAIMSEREKSINSLESSKLVLPSFLQAVTNLSSSIAARFISRIAVTEKQVAYEVATGGDEQGKFLVEAGAYDMAIERLQKVTAKDKSGDDVYNLGLAFEASGEFGLAQEFYREAIKIEPKNRIFAEGLGRIEKLVRENPKLLSQIRSKKQ